MARENRLSEFDICVLPVEQGDLVAGRGVERLPRQTGRRSFCRIFP